MKNRVLMTSVAIASLLTTSAAFAGTFTVSNVSAAQAKQMLMRAKAANTPANELFICNITNLPSQAGTSINVMFPQAGVPTQTPAPGSCAYLVNNGGSFQTQVTIYTPAGSSYVDFNNTLNSGQMWNVAYNADNNSYPVSQGE